MAHISYSLEDFGLSKYESKVYLDLFFAGRGTVLSVAKNTGINRITVHKSVDSLVKLGLVNVYIVGKRRRLIAEPPEKLQILIENQKRSLVSKESFLSDLVNDMYKSVNIVKDNTDSEVKYFKGYKAVRGLYDEMIRAKEVRAIINSTEIYRYFPENSKKFLDAISGGLRLWDLASYTDDKLEYSRWTENFVSYKSKTLPPSMNNLGAIDFSILDESIILIEGGKIPSAIQIKNKVLARLMVQIYDLLWKSLG